MAENKIKKIISSLESEEGRKAVIKEFDDKKFFKLLGSLSEEEKSSTLDLLLECIRIGNSELLRNLAIPIVEKKRFIDWKKQPDLVVSIFDKIVEGFSGSEDVRYGDVVEKLIEMLNSQGLMKKHAGQLYRLVELSLGGQTDPEKLNVHLAALHAVKAFPWSEEKEKLVSLVNSLQATMDKYGDSPEDTVLGTNLYLFFMFAFYMDKNNGRNQKAVIDEIARLFRSCSERDWQCADVPSKNNLNFKLLLSILEYFMTNMGITKADLVRPMYKTVLSLKDCGEEAVENQARRLLADVANESGLVEGDDTSELLESFLDGKMDGVGHKLKDMYLNRPEPFHPLMSRFAERFVESNDSTVSNLLLFFTEVARKEPERITKEVAQHATKLLVHQWYFSLALMFFDAWAAVRPESVVEYENDIIRAAQRNENAAALLSNLLPKIAIDEERKKRYINYLAEKSRGDPSNIMVPSFVNSMRIIGSTDPKLLAPYKGLLEDLMERNPTAKDICRAAINVIEGKSLEKVAEDVKETKKSVDVLQDKMEIVENDVNSVKVEVKEASREIGILQNDLNENVEALNKLEISVTETKAKVEEIDHKTLSHAPSWSREVSKLLNESGERDWRLLARRLGYSNDDIVNWATQADPCMSMLDDWFATHKTRDATHGVMKVLDDMERTDAYSIVEEAIKDAEYMVGEDDDEDETAKGPTPTVFLSYQWAHQQEVKLLKKHLTLSGYPCWMDVGQMGGGDKLYSKIDAGMRTAKVIVCCVSERYAESPNCNREVNLAVNLGKPMIPLLMEKMPWPPKGGMGPIFGEFLFVRFYRREGEGSEDDGLFWPPAMFNQLIMQIRYSVAPNQDLIPDDSPYKNWWDPPEEVIVIKKKEPAKSKDASKAVGSTTTTNNNDEENESPEVFISYQWDKQPEIKDLYRRLTSSTSSFGNFTCWLDINMMGGGDSLYDKIDKGIRGARVVLSCVTKKYALSSNCRREVALSDAIKKPVIPLLLEAGAWPPEGPMGMIMTQLVYVDFSRTDEGARPWDDRKKFDELLAKIRQLVDDGKSVPNAVPQSKDVKSNDKKSSSKSSKPLGNAKPAANQKQPIDKKSTSLSTNRKSSSSSSSSSSASKTKSKVMSLFKVKSPK